MVGDDVKKLLEECTVHEKMKFNGNVRKFYVKACDYAKSKLPLSDKVLLHSEVLDVKRERRIFLCLHQVLCRKIPVPTPRDSSL